MPSNSKPSPDTLSVPAYLASAMSLEHPTDEQVDRSEQWNPSMRRLTTATSKNLTQAQGLGQATYVDMMAIQNHYTTVGPYGASAAIPPVAKHGRP